MAADFANGSPLAAMLQNLVQPKLAEFGWTTGGDDTTLFEYILALLANNKNEAQLASELSNDLLDLGPESIETQQFARWLFEQIDLLRRQLAGGDVDAPNSNDSQMKNTSAHGPAQDMEMEGTSESASGNIPTGPKAMRNGSGSGSGSGNGNGNGTKSHRGGRMLNQLNKQMNRHDESSLHRVRGSQGAGRINSHSREVPKGPRGQNIGRGLDAMANGRGLNNMNMGMSGMNNMSMGGMSAMPMSSMGQNGMPGMLNPQQQMALMQMYEQQAHMMQQIFSGQTPSAYGNPGFQQGKGNKKQPGSNRGSGQANKQNLPPSTKFTKKEGQDENMAEGGAAENEDSMEVETSRPDPSNTMCNFNQRCSKPDCPFVHSSPAAMKGVTVDMSDTCSYGAACTNRKCVGKHPSPAQKQQYQAEQECMFFPNCRDPQNCPYKHPSMPACRNGADCTQPGCKFWHSSVMCKYNPCTNLRCPYKHVEGQKQGFKGNVWVAPKNGDEEKKEHVSERKFIDESQEEELILPEKTAETADAML